MWGGRSPVSYTHLRSLFGGLGGLGCNGDSGVGDETGSLAQLEIALQAVGVQGLLDVVQLHLVALGELLVFFLALFLTDLDVLSGSNGVQQDVRADSGLSGRAQAVSDLSLIHIFCAAACAVAHAICRLKPPV